MQPIDPVIEDFVHEGLGSIADELLLVMADLGVHPLFLNGDDRPRLVAVRNHARDALQVFLDKERARAASVLEQVPSVLQAGDDVSTLLEAGLWSAYSQLPDSVFEPPERESRVFAAVPELWRRVDEDGLVGVAGLDARPFGLFVGDYSLHYHQLLRRGFGSNIHYDLIGLLLSTGVETGCEVRIALDERRLRHRNEHQELFERDYWFGPRLYDESLDNPDAVGETIHGDPECGRSILNPYWALSVRWTRGHAERSSKAVEIEEFLPIDPGGSKYVLARYLHAIRDTSQNAFIHCDGAVKIYDRDGYPADVEAFRRRGRSPRYRKVFRVDGHLGADEWSHIASLWFRGNTLILEYLSGLSELSGAQ